MRALGISLLTAALLSGCSDAAPVQPQPPSSTAPLLAAGPGEGRVAGSYVVVLREGASPLAVASAAGATPRHVYRSALNGFSAALTPAQLAAVRSHPGVEYVEEDRVVAARGTQHDPPWGLDRIDQLLLPLSNSYTWNRDGSGVDVYVIDTGIDATHPEFGGRAHNVYDVFGGSGDDCNGHGTHVTGIVGAKTFGVAKGASLLGVRVLDCNGSGTISGVIAGVDWVTANATQPAVANMSLGGSRSATLDKAVDQMAALGVFTAVAAGGGDACDSSPSGAAGAFAVAGTDSMDFAAGTSYGPCVDVYAPGAKIPSTWPGGGSRTYSGTSASSPHAAGVGALYKAWFPWASSDQVGDWIRKNASPVVVGAPLGTTNGLLNKRDL